MQLLRDNLTLWTSSDGAEPETGAGEAAKAEESKAAATTGSEEKPATEAQPEPAAAS